MCSQYWTPWTIYTRLYVTYLYNLAFYTTFNTSSLFATTKYWLAEHDLCLNSCSNMQYTDAEMFTASPSPSWRVRQFMKLGNGQGPKKYDLLHISHGLGSVSAIWLDCVESHRDKLTAKLLSYSLNNMRYFLKQKINIPSRFSQLSALAICMMENYLNDNSIDKLWV